jgi:hypothetical protein
MHCAAAAIDGPGCRKTKWSPDANNAHSPQIFKKTVQQGLSERRAETYCSKYVAGSERARTKLEVFFNILCAIAAQSVRYTSRRRGCGIAGLKAPDAREMYHWHCLQ